MNRMLGTGAIAISILFHSANLVLETSVQAGEQKLFY